MGTKMKNTIKYVLIVLSAFTIAYILPGFVSTYVFDAAFINSYLFSIVIGIFTLIAVIWIKIDQLIVAINSNNSGKRD